jgi:hypothetical protein
MFGNSYIKVYNSDVILNYSFTYASQIITCLHNLLLLITNFNDSIIDVIKLDYIFKI